MPARGRGRRSAGGAGANKEGEEEEVQSVPVVEPSTSTSSTPTQKRKGPKGSKASKGGQEEEAKEEEGGGGGVGKKDKKPEICLSAITPNDITDESCKTFIFKREGHTLGNSLRFVISQYPEVLFVGHTIPHPSEDELHLRIQTTEGTSAVTVLRKGLQDLSNLCDHVESTFDTAMKKWVEKNPSGEGGVGGGSDEDELLLDEEEDSDDEEDGGQVFQAPAPR